MSPTTPTIHLSATLTPPTLSLSQASPTSPPMLLTLRLLTPSFPGPITFLLHPSALSPAPASYYTSYYQLTSQTTGLPVRQIHTYGLIAPRFAINDTARELMTLYPDAPPVEMEVQLGVSKSSLYDERLSRGENTRSSLAVAATPSAGLRVGERYRVELKDPHGDFPGSIWWWEGGEVEEVLGRRSVGGGETRPLVIDYANWQPETSLSLVMEQGPILEVVE